MEMSIHTEGTQWHVAMQGPFTFSDSSRFRELLDVVTPSASSNRMVSHSQQVAEETMKWPAPEQLSVDIAKVDYMDSAALGMLLLLKEAAEKNPTHILLVGACGQVLKILQLSRFQDIFEMA